jgi:hypothetical protein
MVFPIIEAAAVDLEDKSYILTCVIIARYQLTAIGILPDHYDHP